MAVLSVLCQSSACTFSSHLFTAKRRRGRVVAGIQPCTRDPLPSLGHIYKANLAVWVHLLRKDCERLR